MFSKIAHFQDTVKSLPVWVCGINALIERHRIVESYFHQLLQAVVPQDINFEYKAGELKSYERIQEKAKLELKGNLQEVNDVLRSTFTVNSFAAMQQLDQALQNFAKTNNIHYKRTNKFKDNDPGKFRSIMFKFDFGNHCRGEVQLSIRMFTAVYDITHKRYERIRTLEKLSYLTPNETLELNKLKTENRADHQQAWVACKEEYAAIYGSSE